MVDPRRLGALLARLAEELAELRRLAALDGERGLDRVELAAAKYGFIVAIEAAIDAGQHVISSEGLRPAQDYADVFVVLEEHELLPRDLHERLRGMTGFRNLLVHGYAKVDDGQVRGNLRSRLDDLEALRRALAGLAG